MTDEGALAYGAERVLQGQLPNRDFASLQPPLSYYTAAVMYKVWGTSLLSLRKLGFGIYLALPLLVYGIARSMLGPALSLAAALPVTVVGIPYFHFVPYAAWQGAAASAAAVFLYLRAVRTGSGAGGGLAAGLMTVAAILSRQDQGLYVTLSIVAYTVALNYAGALVAKAALARVFRWWSAGIVLGLAPCAFYWWLKGAIPAMFQQLVVYFLTTYVKTNAAPFPRFSLEQSAAHEAVVGLFYLPPVVCLLAAFWLWRQFRRRRWGMGEANVTFMLAWAGLFFCQVLGRSDIFHLLLTLIPFFILSACLWGAALESGLPKVPFSVAGAVAVGGFLVLTKTMFLGSVRREPEVPLARAGVHYQSGAGLAAFVKEVQQIAPRDRAILCLPYQPMLYFLCERRNPTRWNYLWRGDQTAADHQTLVTEARRDPPAVVVLDDEAELGRFAPVVLDYVHADYRKTAQLGTLSIYLPK